MMLPNWGKYALWHQHFNQEKSMLKTNQEFAFSNWQSPICFSMLAYPPVQGFVLVSIFFQFWLGGAAPQTLRLLAEGAKPPQTLPRKGSSLAFDRGNQTGPPRSNAFFCAKRLPNDPRLTPDQPFRPARSWPDLCRMVNLTATTMPSHFFSFLWMFNFFF